MLHDASTVMLGHGARQIDGDPSAGQARGVVAGSTWMVAV
jgi:hypothetical protein